MLESMKLRGESLGSMALAAAVIGAAVLLAAADADDREEAVRLARQTLARQLAIAEDDIALEDAQSVDWPDAALGCPEKDVMYAQMIVQGYLVRLSVSGATHEVHVGGGRAVICGGTPATREPSYMATVTRLQTLARRDLAARLEVDEKRVKVNFVRPAVWPDAGLGCPEPGRSYAQTETRGFLIELQHKGRRYEYHSDMERVVACGKR
jgi:hypothetical protein